MKRARLMASEPRIGRAISWRTLMWAALAAIALSGCASLESKSRSLSLTENVKSYTKSIRWGDFDIATRYMKSRDGEEISVDTAHLKGLRVTQYDFEIQASDPEAKVARMIATFDYQPAGSVTVRQVRQSAEWWYSDELEKWFLDAGLPDFR